MQKFAKIIDNETKKVSVIIGNATDEFIKANGYSLQDVEQSDIDNDWYLSGYVPIKTDEQKAQERQTEFEKEFFLTSLGYIRRNVNMATGQTKDFLADLLPTISMAVTAGQKVPIITYSEPDFTKEFTLEYMESLQTVKNVTPQFIQECALQLSKDFLPTALSVE